MKQKEWKCPLGHWTTIKLITFAGGASTMLGFAMPHSLAICETCGVVFDHNKVEKRDKP